MGPGEPRRASREGGGPGGWWGEGQGPGQSRRPKRRLPSEEPAQPDVGEGVSLVREPDAGDPHVRFDGREVETEQG